MRNQFIVFLKEIALKEDKEKSIRAKESAIETRLRKLRDNAEYRLRMIEEFKSTLDQLEFGEKLKEHERTLRKEHHFEFLEKLKEDKMFKQEMYAIQRILEFEDKKQLREREMEFQHSKLLKEQEEVMKNIELMLKAHR